MYFTLASLFALASLAGVNGITVTSPTSSTVWSSGTGSQTVSWQAVDTDATSFVIQLVNQAGYLTNSPVTLVANQSTGSANVVNSATVTYPSGTWPVGVAFQINLISSSTTNAAILAQSQQFNITNSGTVSSASSASSSSSSASAPTTISASKTSTSASSTSASLVTVTSSSSGDASGGIIPNAASETSTSAGELTSSPSALVSILLAAAGALGVFA